MKAISDIRLYKSLVENIPGNSMPSDFGDRSLNLIERRIAMKLREQAFSLGEFDHLYLNFTTCLPDNTILPSKREADRYHSWYRYYDIGVSQELFEHLGSSDTVAVIIALLKQTLLQYFAPDEPARNIIEAAVEEAVTKGPEMLIRFKEKKAAKTAAVIYLQLLDNAQYQPILSVCDLQGNELLREALALTIDFSSLGEIQLGSRKVTVKPRKNVFAKDLQPATFTF